MRKGKDWRGFYLQFGFATNFGGGKKKKRGRGSPPGFPCCRSSWGGKGIGNKAGDPHIAPSGAPLGKGGGRGGKGGVEIPSLCPPGTIYPVAVEIPRRGRGKKGGEKGGGGGAVREGRSEECVISNRGGEKGGKKRGEEERAGKEDRSSVLFTI